MDSGLGWVWDRLYDGRVCSRRDVGLFVFFLRMGRGLIGGVLFSTGAGGCFWFLVAVLFLRSFSWWGVFAKKAWYILCRFLDSSCTYTRMRSACCFFFFFFSNDRFR
jgi:hypothetical protein